MGTVVKEVTLDADMDVYEESENIAFASYIWDQYDENADGLMTITKTHLMLQDLVQKDVSISKDICSQFISFVKEHVSKEKRLEKKNDIIKSEFLEFVMFGVRMSSMEREKFSNRSALHRTIVAFFNGIDEARSTFHTKQRRSIEAFLDHIWGIYDRDSNGHIDAEETTYMLQDLTGLHDIKATECKAFLLAIDTDKNGTIDKVELSDFIFHGILMDKEERLEYAKRGNFQSILVQFFNGVDKAKKIFLEQGKTALHDYMSDIADPDIKINEIKAYIDRYLWDKYNVNDARMLNAEDTTRMFEEVSTVKWSRESCQELIETIAERKKITKQNLIDFVCNHEYQCMPVHERDNYVKKKGHLHGLIIKLLEGISRESKVFRDKEVAK